MRSSWLMTPASLAYLFMPMGLVLIVLSEFIYFIWDIFEGIIRFLFGRIPMNVVLRSTGRTSFVRYRKVTHMMGMSIPLLFWYAWIYKYDLKEIPEVLELFVAFTVSICNILYILVSLLVESRHHDIAFGEYLILSFRLFGGFIPQLRGIKNGQIAFVNWVNFTFGSYSFAKF